MVTLYDDQAFGSSNVTSDDIEHMNLHQLMN